MSVVRFVAIFFLALSFGVAVARAASVGMVTKVENQAQIGSEPAVVGSLVQTNDVVTTGPKSRLEISFRDNTKLSLGENATRGDRSLCLQSGAKHRRTRAEHERGCVSDGDRQN